MSFEYRFQVIEVPTLYNNPGTLTLSETFKAPEGFRLRDVKVIEFGEVVNTTLNGVSGHTSTTKNAIHKALITWEKPVFEKEDE